MSHLGKRNGAPDGTPAKAMKGPGADDADQWTCGKCGNLNFGTRVVCNMRSCGAPKDQENWTCTGCGNDNYANRLFCNMKRCQMIRPGTTMAQMQQLGGKGAPAGGGGGGGGKGGCGKGHFAMAPQGDPRAHEPGAWTCSCGNLNYAGRATCNSRSCGQAMPQQQQQWGGYGAYEKGGYGGYAPAPYAAPYAAPYQSAGKGGGSQPPPGSWECTSCQNVNWPTRDKCNAKSCGQPRHAVDGGAPRKKPDLGSAPPGSWVCATCENVNFPTRTSCNKKGCGLPKP